MRTINMSVTLLEFSLLLLPSRLLCLCTSSSLFMYFVFSVYVLSNNKMVSLRLEPGVVIRRQVRDAV